MSIFTCRSGAFLLSFGTGYQELNLIISDLKSLKSQVKAVRDSQQTILQDITNWTCVDENRALQELFLHLSDLNALWSEVQTNFAGLSDCTKFSSCLMVVTFSPITFHILLKLETYQVFH